MLFILQKNGISFAEKDFDFPFTLKVKNLQVNQPDLTAKIAEIEIELSFIDLIGGEISGDYLIVSDGVIHYSSTQTSDGSEPVNLKDLIPISFKNINLSDISFKNDDDGDTLLLTIPELLITNLHLGKIWHIESLSNKGSKLEWLSHSINDKPEEKTDTTHSGFSLADFPEFTVENLNFVDCDFFFQTPSQKHSVKNFNLELVPQKENDQFTMAVNKFSLIYQDTLNVNLNLNKVLVNNKEEMQISDLAFDFPWLKLRIPKLNLSNNESFKVDAQFRDSYVNTALVKIFLPEEQLPLAHDLDINFEGAVSYVSGGVGFEKVTLSLSKNTELTLDGYADIPGKTGAGLQLKLLDLHTSTSDLAELFEWQNKGNQKLLNITAAIALTGNYDNLKGFGSISLNKMASSFSAAVDQRDKNSMKVSIDVRSREVDLNQFIDSLGAELMFTNFHFSAQAAFNAKKEISNVTALVTGDSMFLNAQRLGDPSIKFRLTPAAATANIDFPELFSLTLNSPDNIRGEKVRFTGAIKSTLPQLSNFDSSAGEFSSRFSGLFANAASNMELILVLDTVRFLPASFDKEYLANGILTAGRNKRGDLNASLSLDGNELVRFETSGTIYDWWNRKNKWDGNYPDTKLDMAFSIDSLLVSQFTGQKGLVQLDKLHIRAGGDDITAVIELPVLSMNTYDLRDVSGNIESYSGELNADLSVGLFQNPYAILEALKILVVQKDDETVRVSMKTLLPEIQNSMELNTLISYTDTTYLFNLDDNDLKLGAFSWQNADSRGFIFNHNFDLVYGDLTIVNGRQKIDMETNANMIALTVESLSLDPIAQILTNDSLIHGDLSFDANYNLVDEIFYLSGAVSEIRVHDKKMGSLKFEGLKSKENLNASIKLDEEYGKIDFSIRKDETPLEYALDVVDLDLTFINSGAPWESTLPVTGKVNAKLGGGYDKELTSLGYVGFNDVETYLADNKIYLRADKDTLWFRNTDVIANDFKVYDKKDNILLLDGKLTIASEPLIDMTIRSNEFRILETSGKSNDIKGTVDMLADLQIKRSPNQFKISGNLAVLPNSNINYLYESTVTLDERENEVTFVSFDELDKQDADTLAAFRFTNRSKPIEWDVKLKVKKSEITIVLDETSQDKIKMTAEGDFLLKTGTNDNPYLYGMLKSNEGSIAYDAPMVSDIDLKIENVLVKWDGEIDEPRMTFLGSETFRVQPKGIPGMSNSTSVVPIDVVVKVNDRPINDFELSFDLNSTNAKVKSWIQSLPEDTREANAINLLLFGTLNFGETADNPSYVQSVAAKMNEISRRNLKNADLTFYSQSQNVTELDAEPQDNLGYTFSKGLFNKNVKISVGGTLDFNSSPDSDNKKSSILSNIKLDYIISETPDIFLSGAQETTYDGVINGEIGETSVGITYLKRFRNIFKSTDKNISK